MLARTFSEGFLMTTDSDTGISEHDNLDDNTSVKKNAGNPCDESIHA